MCFKIILKVTKNHGSTLSVEDTFFKKPQGGWRGGGGGGVGGRQFKLPDRLGLKHSLSPVF